MDTLKNFNRYGVITFIIEEYENGSLEYSTSSTQNIPYGQTPTLPADPSNPFDPLEPWTSADKPTPVPVSGDATYTIKYYYTSEIIIAYMSSDGTIDPTAPYVSRDPSGFLLLKNLGSVTYNCQQLCIEDTDFGVPPLNYINQIYSTNFQPGIMTAELKHYIEQEGGIKVYCPGNTSTVGGEINGSIYDPTLFQNVNYGSWDYYGSYILTSTDMEIIRSTFTQSNMRWLNGSTPTRFSDIQGWTGIFSSLFDQSKATPYIRYDQNQGPIQMQSNPAGWIPADYSLSSTCLTQDSGNYLNRDYLRINYSSQYDREVQYGLIRLKDPSRCIYTS